MCDRCWCRKCTWNVFGLLGSRAARPTPSAPSALGAGLAARDPLGGPALLAAASEASHGLARPHT
jgi:hypothetical protein